MQGNLPLAIALIGVGGLLVWVGYADPAGGLFGVIGNAVQGKRSTRSTAAPAGGVSTTPAPVAAAPASSPVTPVPGTRVTAQ